MKAVKALLAAVFMMVLGMAAVAGDTTVRIAGFGGQDKEIVEDLIAKFVQPKLPGVKIAYEPVEGDYLPVMLNSLAAGTAADLFYMDIFWAGNVIQNGSVEPLDSYIAKSKVIKKADFIKNLMTAFESNGKQYGIPKDFNTLAIFYNKEIFDEAKVAYPDDKDTWETLEAKMAALKKAIPDVTPIALAPDFARMGAFAYGAGFEPIKGGKTNLQDKGFTKAFNWYTGLESKKLGIMPADAGQGWGGGAFAEEKTAMCIEGAWIINFLKDKAPNMEYGTAPIPKDGVTKKRGNFIFTVAWGLYSKSKVKNEAFQVMEILTSPEAQNYVLEKGLALPSRKALLNNPFFQKQDKAAKANLVVFNGAADGNVKPFYFEQYGGRWMDPINAALNVVMGGNTDSKTALKRAQGDIDTLMK